MLAGYSAAGKVVLITENRQLFVMGGIGYLSTESGKIFPTAKMRI